MSRLVLTLVGGILGGFLSTMFFSSQAIHGANNDILKVRQIDLMDKMGDVAVSISVDDFLPEEAGIIFANSKGKQFCMIKPGIFTVKYPTRKGGGSFLWAGPGFGGGCELQIIAADNQQGTGPNISVKVDNRGFPSLGLYRPNGDLIMSLPK